MGESKIAETVEGKGEATGEVAERRPARDMKSFWIGLRIPISTPIYSHNSPETG